MKMLPYCVEINKKIRTLNLDSNDHTYKPYIIRRKKRLDKMKPNGLARLYNKLDTIDGETTTAAYV